VNEDRCCSNCDVEVVVVVAGDGQVPHPAVTDGRDRSSDHDRSLAIRGFEMQVGVVVDEDAGDGLGLVLAALGVAGQNRVARLELADRDGLAAGEQDEGPRGEQLAPAREGRGLLAAGPRPGRRAPAPGVRAVVRDRAHRRVAHALPGGRRGLRSPAHTTHDAL